MINTMMVVTIVSCRVGQETFVISWRTSRIYLEGLNFAATVLPVFLKLVLPPHGRLPHSTRPAVKAGRIENAENRPQPPTPCPEAPTALPYLMSRSLNRQ